MLSRDDDAGAAIGKQVFNDRERTALAADVAASLHYLGGERLDL